ncbi:MAG: hypothetical protein MUF08_03155 [Burkholderiaceae bacterium]|nr:hypothetical protein [Burkholderiaceae bacterium]MCU0964061.1 hypothetical protein [Burkholderiaceae bacterium]
MSSLLDQLLDPHRAELCRQHDAATTADALARRVPAPVVTAEERAELLRLWDEYERAHDAWHAQEQPAPAAPIVLNDRGWCVTGGVYASQPMLQVQPWVLYDECGSLDAPCYVPTGAHESVVMGNLTSIYAEQLREGVA